MRVCANENIPEDCVIRLRQSGHDVLWIRETSPGCSDVGVIDRALAEDRLLITFDNILANSSFDVAEKHRAASYSCASRKRLR